MAAKKSFTTRAPEEVETIDINGTEFTLNSDIPGDVLLDFITSADEESPAAMAAMVRNLLNAAIAEHELDRWHAFIRDPKNHVTLDVLAEVAGHASEVMSGNGRKKPAELSTNG